MTGSGAVPGAGAPGPAGGEPAQIVAGATAAGWGRRAGLVGLGVAGVTAGLLAAGFAAERLSLGRAVRQRAREALEASAPYGSLRGTPGTVSADDGTELYYETDEPDDPGHGGEPALTVVFCHGYCLHQDVWHFQRAALRALPGVRAVYWDQRGHGRSGRGVPGERVSIDRLGRDLRTVIDAAAPTGPVVLVGHSMGGMTVMALADSDPEYVAERVAGVALLATSAGKLSEVTYGLPAFGVRTARRVVPGVLRALATQASLVERGRRATADLFASLVHRYSFGRPDEVEPSVARFAERLIESVPVDVVADFYPAFGEHEKTAALAAFAGRPALVLAGDKDLLTPSGHSEAVAEALGEGPVELVLVEGAGHLVLLEHPETVADRLTALLVRAGAPAGTDAA